MSEPRTPEEIFKRIKEVSREHGRFPYEIADLKSKLRPPGQSGPHMDAFMLLHDAEGSLIAGIEKLEKYINLIDNLQAGREEGSS